MDHPLSALKTLLGTWKTTGTTHDDPPLKLNATDSYELLGAGGFIIHRVAGKLGESELNSIEMIGYDQDKKAFSMHSFDDSGNTEQMTATLEGDRWKITGEEARFEGKLGSHRITGTWERRTASGWEPWMSIVLTRQH